MNRVTDALARFLSPVMRPVSRWLLSDRRRWQTWRYEFALVGTLLLLVTLLTIDWSSRRAVIGAWAAAVGVFFSFGHAKVASRMMEAQAVVEVVTVSCYRMSETYWLIKEIAWFAAFMATGMYPALVGNFLFLLYPAWRKVHLDTRFALRGTRLAPGHAAAVSAASP